jgi:hypothetical protein
MMSGEKPVIVSEKISFGAVLDETCERLMDRQIRYSIRRLQEMEDRLGGLEQELDAFLLQRPGKRDE